MVRILGKKHAKFSVKIERKKFTGTLVKPQMRLHTQITAYYCTLIVL